MYARSYQELQSFYLIRNMYVGDSTIDDEIKMKVFSKGLVLYE
jgi:hypothetical protein